MWVYIIISYIAGLALSLSCYLDLEIVFLENNPRTMIVVAIISFLLSPISVPTFIVGLIFILIRGAIKENKNNDE